MKRRYVTADVFTDRMFGGNPLAVVLDALGLSAAQMQAIALEFNYSETTFVLPPQDVAHTAHIRIFTPRAEIPFAGHPNVGTAFLLSRERRFEDAAAGGSFVFEESAGLVPLRLLREGDAIVGAELRAPEALSQRTVLSPASVAMCLSLLPQDVVTIVHAPQIVSVGLPFLVVELGSRQALSRAKPNLAAYGELMPLDGADAIFAYTRESATQFSAEETALCARMFSPLDGIVEDPATGSAAAATVALLATLSLDQRTQRAWSIHQGIEIGRPSLLRARTIRRDGAVVATYVGGQCVAVLEGTFVLKGSLSP
jgi:trans-2,3-dihydro-3-hydroxyanthranilate isomerase